MKNLFMLKSKYLTEITDKISRFSQDKNIKSFIFGSSLIKENFGDVDIGLTGDINEGELSKLKEEFEKSTLPYFIDVVNFNKVSDSFRDNVFNNEVLWITR